MNWKALNQLEALEEVIERSFRQPVLIYKHSTRCSISSMVLSRLERSWDSTQIPEVSIYFLDLIAHREVSNEIAKRFRVYHESPQVLLIVDGESVFDTSHMGIGFTAIKSAIAGVSAKT